MGLADVRVGTQKIVVLLSTRPNISESHSELSTRVPFCITDTRRRLTGHLVDLHGVGLLLARDLEGDLDLEGLDAKYKGIVF